MQLSREHLNSMKSKFCLLQEDTQLLLDDGRDVMKRSKNQDYARKLVQKLCAKIEQMRSVVYDIVEAERELFKLDAAKDKDKDKKLMYLSPLEFDAAVNYNVPVWMPKPGSFVYSAIYPNDAADAGRIGDFSMSHLTSCRLAVWQQFSKPLALLASSVKRAGWKLTSKQHDMGGGHRTVNKVGHETQHGHTTMHMCTR